MAAPVNWFEVATADPAGAKAFYGELLGWTFVTDEAMPDYTLIRTGDGEEAGGGLFATRGEVPNYSIFVAQVADVAATCKSAETLGGKVMMEPVTMDTGLTYAHLLDRDGQQFAVYSAPAPPAA